MGASSRPSRAVSPPTARSMASAIRPGVAIVGPDPQVLGGRRAVIGGGVREVLVERPTVERERVRITDPQHAERLLVVLVVDEAERPGVVTGRHRPAPVEGGAEHRHDSDDDGRRGQAGRDLPPPEPVAREVDLEGRRPPWRQRGPGRRPRGRGAPRRPGAGRRPRRVGRAHAIPNDAMARVHPRTAHVWRSARPISSGRAAATRKAHPSGATPKRAGVELEQRGQVGRIRPIRARP